MNNQYRVEFYQWFQGGLNINQFFFDTNRKAMDYAYGNALDWLTLKVYDIDGSLMHQNSSTADTYA